MWFHSLLASWKSGHSRSRRPKPRSFRPALEVLEDRCTPSSLSGYVKYGYPNPYDLGPGGVTVTLLEPVSGYANHWTPVQVTKTAAGSGAYSFTGLQPGLYAIEVNVLCDVFSVVAVNGVGTVNGQRDGEGPIPGPPAAPSTEIVDISLGANQSGINYDFYLRGFSGG
jgi:hypothetical protein